MKREPKRLVRVPVYGELSADELEMVLRYRRTKARGKGGHAKRLPSVLFVATRLTGPGEIPFEGYCRVFAFTEPRTVRAFVGEESAEYALAEYVIKGPMRKGKVAS